VLFGQLNACHQYLHNYHPTSLSFSRLIASIIYYITTTTTTTISTTATATTTAAAETRCVLDCLTRYVDIIQ